ncbi:hypothetical protein [Anaerophilus nitritogenes]|uniref:hypothetical protein n=1 Tax=Anaerophilus nitritogenes TaxID=2498136 RepID=UPI00101B6EF2|nr:hypothetical protein [Anaerophilus nitritogenes]
MQERRERKLKMKLKMKRIIPAGAVLVTFTIFSCICVFAATDYWGSSSSYSAGSYTARHASRYAQARTVINNDGSSNLPPGSMGVNPKAYSSSTGTLLESGGWEYTDGSSAGYDVPVDVSDYSGYMYSQGMTALWNGNGYTTKSTTASPSAKFKSSTRMNSSGETYGTAAKARSIEEEPDLILAEGVDGVEGYVRSSDLNANIAKSPQEAVKIMKNKSPRFIPLYKSDGKTVIGKFKITPPKAKDIKTITN